MKSMMFSLSAPLYFESLFWKRFAIIIALRYPLLSQCSLVSFELAGELVWWWWACEWGDTAWNATVGWCVLCCGGTYTEILHGTIGGRWWDWGIVGGMPSWGAGPERLTGDAGGAETTAGTGRDPAIVGFVSWNWEYASIIGQIAALYWFKASFSNRFCENTGNVDVFGVPDAWAWTIAVGIADGKMNDES